VVVWPPLTTTIASALVSGSDWGLKKKPKPKKIAKNSPAIIAKITASDIKKFFIQL
jgi:hypothetical protein